MEPQELLKFLIAKIKSGELKAITEQWKRKYVEMNEIENYNGIAVDEENLQLTLINSPRIGKIKVLKRMPL